LGIGQTCNLSTIALVTSSVVAGTAKAVKADAHHVEVVEAVDTGVHPEFAHFVNTTKHTRT
jgi:hypothetical protein